MIIRIGKHEVALRDLGNDQWGGKLGDMSIEVTTYPPLTHVELALVLSTSVFGCAHGPLDDALIARAMSDLVDRSSSVVEEATRQVLDLPAHKKRVMQNAVAARRQADAVSAMLRDAGLA